MSDAEQSAPPAKRPRLETAQEAYEAACKKYSSCEEYLRQLQVELRQEMRKGSNSDLVAALQKAIEEASKDKEQASKAVEEASKDKDFARETLRYEREQAKQSEARVVKQCC